MNQFRWLTALVVGAFFLTGIAFGSVVPGDAAFECRQVGVFDYAYKIDNWAGNMTGGYTDPVTGVTFNITDYKPANNTFDWSATAAMDAVIVKAGPGSKVYTYAIPADFDTGLVAPDDKEVSHVTFCWNEYEPLEVTKDAAGSYDRRVEWDIAKDVDVPQHVGFAGQVVGSSEWKILITKTVFNENYEVTGSITITNPNDIPVKFSVADVLNDGTVATVTCDTDTVPANGSVPCTYVANPKDGTANLNTATVISLTAGVMGGFDTATVFYDEVLVGFDEATLTDDRFPGLSDIIETTDIVLLEEDFTCSSDTSLYVNGRYEQQEPNIATLAFGNDSKSADAKVVVICTLPALEVEKTAAGEWDREVTWELTKTVDPESHTGYAGEEAGTSTWTVEATKTDSGPMNFRVSGSITIDNPAAVPQTITAIEDTLTGAREDLVGVDCASELPITIPAFGQVVCTYEASQPDATAKLNIVVVTADGNVPQDDMVGVEWTENLEGYDKGLLDDKEQNFSQTIDDSFKVTFDETFFCPADDGQYVGGKYEFKPENTATLNGNINLSASATATVTCYIENLDVSKTVDTSYVLEHLWSIDKTVATANGEMLDGYPKVWLYADGSGDETATWTVDVKYVGYDGRDFNVTGTITIENKGFDAVIKSVDDLLGGTTIAVCGGVTFPYTLHAGETLECDYDEDGYVEGFNVVTVTTERGSYEATEPIVWGDPTTEINKTVTVKDISGLFGEVVLGTLTAQSARFTYTKHFAWADYGADGCGSFTYENTATIVETKQSDSATLKVNVQCFVYETAYAKGDEAECFIPDFSRWGWTNPITPDNYEMELWAAAAQCDTGKGTLVGTVTVVYDADGYVTVTYNVGAPYMLDETHVYAGVDMYPKRGRRSTVAPGSYTNASPFDGDQVYVIAHAVVGLPDPGFGP